MTYPRFGSEPLPLCGLSVLGNGFKWATTLLSVYTATASLRQTYVYSAAAASNIGFVDTCMCGCLTPQLHSTQTSRCISAVQENGYSGIHAWGERMVPLMLNARHSFGGGWPLEAFGCISVLCYSCNGCVGCSGRVQHTYNLLAMQSRKVAPPWSNGGWCCIGRIVIWGRGGVCGWV
jgi:hypothetical protein